MTRMASVPHDRGAVRGGLAVDRGRRVLRQMPFQAAFAAASRMHVIEPLAKRLNERGKPHKVVIIAIACRLIITANAVVKTGKK